VPRLAVTPFCHMQFTRFYTRHFYRFSSSVASSRIGGAPRLAESGRQHRTAARNSVYRVGRWNPAGARCQLTGDAPLRRTYRLRRRPPMPSPPCRLTAAADRQRVRRLRRLRRRLLRERPLRRHLEPSLQSLRRLQPDHPVRGQPLHPRRRPRLPRRRPLRAGDLLADGDEPLHPLPGGLLRRRRRRRVVRGVPRQRRQPGRVFGGGGVRVRDGVRRRRVGGVAGVPGGAGDRGGGDGC
jgi:hypothetical protein